MVSKRHETNFVSTGAEKANEEIVSRTEEERTD